MAHCTEHEEFKRGCKPCIESCQVQEAYELWRNDADDGFVVRLTTRLEKPSIIPEGYLLDLSFIGKSSRKDARERAISLAEPPLRHLKVEEGL